MLSPDTTGIARGEVRVSAQVMVSGQGESAARGGVRGAGGGRHRVVGAPERLGGYYHGGVSVGRGWGEGGGLYQRGEARLGLSR